MNAVTKPMLAGMLRDAMLGHLLEVYFRAGDYSKCRAVMDKINEKVRKIGTLHFEDYVSEEIREFIASESHAESQV